ncbi:MAG: PEF-CTERM sorting domain-containing protein [Euryarchaeota archaeon]|nr:PEF-CTERM sorting domain-containing protein [Euryarchaeota archaeon]MCG2737849.1 PEF-CTERM sorting domain-containing protein [Candidatus Methanoperedenaceae archaeon]
MRKIKRIFPFLVFVVFILMPSLATAMPGISVTVNPTDKYITSGGITIDYLVTIRNDDDGIINPDPYNKKITGFTTGTPPVGWTYQYDTSNIIGQVLSPATDQSRTFTLSVSVPATVQSNDVLQQFSHEVKGFTELETELYDGCMNDFGDYEICFSPENDPEGFNTLVSPNTGNTAIPEFPTIALPIISVIGLLFVMRRSR